MAAACARPRPRRRSCHPGLALALAAALAAASASAAAAPVAAAAAKGPEGEESCGCPVSNIGLEGEVGDCCCDYATVDDLNERVLHPTLSELVRAPFFRYFKVDIHCDCPFWENEGICAVKDCSVCECPEEEVPSPWRRAHREPAEGEEQPPSCLDAGTVEAYGADGGGGGGAYGGVTLGDLADADASVEPGFLAWAEDASNPWTAEYDSGAGRGGGGDGAPGNAQYINLLLNPERFTGYAGPSAAKVWGAIYDENCFLEGGSGVPEEMAGADECVERRVFYRLISGLHASISTHIAGEYPMTYDGPDVVEWGPNADDFFTRVGYHPKRVENLYFAFLFVLRAATKAAPLLERASFDTGNAIDDTRTTELVRALVRSPELAAACPLPFDEATLWRDDAGGALREQLRARFANISAVMDCVGCEKCKVWGKLQVLGLGTALKILFANDDLGASELTLQRNEVIALFNTLERFSKSIMTLQHFLVERYGADEGAPSDEGEEGSREARGMGMEHGHLAGHLSPSKSPTRARAPPPAFMAHGDEL